MHISHLDVSGARLRPSQRVRVRVRVRVKVRVRG